MNYSHFELNYSHFELEKVYMVIKGIYEIEMSNKYCHSQTDCFVVSQLFSVARHVGRLKLGSKSGQLYVRFSTLPHGGWELWRRNLRLPLA